MSAAGGATGLVAGGLITQYVSWRWVMFVNVPIGIAVWLVGRAVLSETGRREGHFDVAGAIGATIGVAGIVLGLVQAGADGWTSPLTIGPLLVGVAVLVAFVWHEGRATEPILPLQLLTNRTRSSANGARALLYAGFYGLFYFLAQFLQEVQGYSPVQAGLAFLPMPASVFLSSQLTSRVLMRRLPEKVVMLLGTGVGTLGLLLATHVGTHSSYQQIVVSLVLLGVGAGMTFVALTSASLEDVAPDIAGAASGLVNVSQQLGAAVGLAVLVTVFNALGGQTKLASPGTASSGAAHPLDVVFAVGALFALASFITVLTGVRGLRRPSLAMTQETEEAAPTDGSSLESAVEPSEVSFSRCGAGDTALENLEYAHTA
jgi:MFS family permease